MRLFAHRSARAILMASVVALALRADNTLPETFDFNESECSPLKCLQQFRAKCEVHMIFDATRRAQNNLKFKFVRAGKDLFVLGGHARSVFCGSTDTLYFAHFEPTDCGCTVVAYNLDTGKLLWKTDLHAVGQVKHSAYRNEVLIGFCSGGIMVTGRESYGDYVEVLDRNTGATIAHRIYRKGFK